MSYIGRKGATSPLNSGDIPDGIIIAADLAPNSVDSSELVDGSVDNSHLADDAVGTDELANDVVINTSGSITTTGALSSATLTTTGNITMGDDTSIGISDSDERIEFDGAGDISVMGANLGIGTNVPDDLLHIYKGDSSATPHTFSAFNIEHNDDVSMNMLTATDKYAAVYFGDSAHANDGGIVYQNHDTTAHMIFRVNDGEKMRINASGHAGIGTSSPSYRLHVYNNSASQWLALFDHDGNSSNRYGILVQVGTDAGHGTNEAMQFNDGDGTKQGAIIHTSGTVTYQTFTAGHDVELPDADNDNGYPYGTLLEIIEIFYTKKKDGTATERGILYRVKKTSSAYSKSVLGVYSSKYTVKPAQAEILYEAGDELPEGKSVGDIKVEAVAVQNENLHICSVLGDGHIICNGEKGNISIGDGICTSSTDGEGMKADKMAMIIGIAQEDVTFSGSETKLVAVQYGLQQFTPWTE